MPNTEKEMADKISQACTEASNSLLSLAEKIKEAFGEIEPSLEKTKEKTDIELATMDIDQAKEMYYYVQEGFDPFKNVAVRRLYQDNKLVKIYEIARDGTVTNVSDQDRYKEEFE